MPTAFTFAHGANVWTETDEYYLPFVTEWSAAGEARTMNVIMFNDDRCSFALVSDGTYRASSRLSVFDCLGQEVGTYTLTTDPIVPVAGAPALGPVGIALLFGALGAAGYRRLRV